MSSSHSSCAAVVVAAGRGLRAGLPGPKQFAGWRGRPMVRGAVEALNRAGIVRIVVVAPVDALDQMSAILAGTDAEVVAGGATRRWSVRAGLEALAGAPPESVLIHDAARPDLPGEVVERLVAALADDRAVIPVLPIADSLVRDGAPVPREGLWRVQTPQAFDFATVLAAHRALPEAAEPGDDAEVARAAGIAVAQVAGDERLRKMTYAADFAVALLPRVGMGFDVHRLADGEELWIGGVKIPHSQGLVGHSDADVAIHALVDALLGAIAAGDIGQHFPPSDPRWKGAASGQFLTHAMGLVGQAGYRLGNADITLICEAPKIGPHRETIRARLAELMAAEPVQVSVKATTTEKLGFTGRGEGIAAQAVVTLVPLS